MSEDVPNRSSTEKMGLSWLESVNGLMSIEFNGRPYGPGQIHLVQLAVLGEVLARLKRIEKHLGI